VFFILFFLNGSLAQLLKREAKLIKTSAAFWIEGLVQCKIFA